MYILHLNKKRHSRESGNPGCKLFFRWKVYDLIGVGKDALAPSPPSEPDVRISRIRLSSRWFYLIKD